MSEHFPPAGEIHDVEEVGMVRLVSEPWFPDIFVTRISSDARPEGALETNTPGEYLIAFSRLCTHMGAHLVADRDDGSVIASIVEEGVIRCPCHLSCFDLTRDGLVVIGQATAPLAQVELARENSGLKLVRWMSLAYGETEL